MARESTRGRHITVTQVPKIVPEQTAEVEFILWRDDSERLWLCSFLAM